MQATSLPQDLLIMLKNLLKSPLKSSYFLKLELSTQPINNVI